MKQKVYVGIDLAKDSSRVAVIDEDGSKLLNPFNIKNTKEGMEKLLSRLSSYKNDHLLCGMEASSNYWENVHSYLMEKKVSCLLLNPYQVRKYRQALGLKIKTDSVDAEAVAQLIRAKKYDNLYISDGVAVELKELVRMKVSFARRVKDLKNSVQSLLCLVFRQYTSIISHPFSKASIEILSKYPTSFHMAKTSVARLSKIFKKYQGCSSYKDKAEDLIASARHPGQEVCLYPCKLKRYLYYLKRWKK